MGFLVIFYVQKLRSAAENKSLQTADVGRSHAGPRLYYSSQRPLLLLFGLKGLQETQDNDNLASLGGLQYPLSHFLELCIVSSKDRIYLVYMSKKSQLNFFFFQIRLFGWHY